MPSALSRRAALAMAAGVALSGCGTDATRAEVSVSAVDHGRVQVLLRPPRGPEGTARVDDTFTSLLAEHDVPAEVVTSATVEEQLTQLSRLSRPTLVVVQPWPDARVSTLLRELRDDGSTVVTVLDRPPSWRDASVVVGWDEFGAGERQFAALLAGLRDRHGEEPGGVSSTRADSWNIELVGGDPDDTADELRLQGCLWAFKPFGKQGSVAVKTGQTSWSQVATPGNDPEFLSRRLTTTLAATYTDWVLHGLITGSPEQAATVRQVIEAAGKSTPLLVTGGVDRDVVAAISEGDLHATTYHDPSRLVRAAVDTIVTLRSGGPLVVNPHVSYHNRYDTWLGSVPAILPTPDLLTRATAPELLSDNPVLAAALR